MVLGDLGSWALHVTPLGPTWASRGVTGSLHPVMGTSEMVVT